MHMVIVHYLNHICKAWLNYCIAKIGAILVPLGRHDQGYFAEMLCFALNCRYLPSARRDVDIAWLSLCETPLGGTLSSATQRAHVRNARFAAGQVTCFVKQFACDCIFRVSASSKQLVTAVSACHEQLPTVLLTSGNLQADAAHLWFAPCMDMWSPPGALT